MRRRQVAGTEQLFRFVDPVVRRLGDDVTRAGACHPAGEYLWFACF